MKRIYKGKTKLRVQIDTKCDLSGFEEVTVIAKKPNDTLKNFPAVVKDIEAGLIFFDIQEETDFDVSGWWTLWPEVRFDDDRTACGRAVRFFVFESGSI